MKETLNQSIVDGIKLLTTKYINSNTSINWREKSIHKTNKPPCGIEGDCHWKQDNTEM